MAGWVTLRANAEEIAMMAPTRLPRSTFLPGQVPISEGESVTTIAMTFVVTSVMTSIVMTEVASSVARGVAPQEEQEDTDLDEATTTPKGQTSART